MDVTAEQIEARALALFQERKTNLSRRDRYSAERMVFEGEERDFCMGAVKYHLAEEAYQARKAEAEIAYWSRTSTPALKAMIDRLQSERKAFTYGLATHTAIQELDREELYRMTAEYTRRLSLKIAADDAATDAAISESAARLADMRTPIVRGADLSATLEAAE